MYLVHSFIFYSSCTGLSIRGSTKYFYTQSFPIICQKKHIFLNIYFFVKKKVLIFFTIDISVEL